MTVQKKHGKFFTGESYLTVLSVCFLSGVLLGTLLYCNSGLSGQDRLVSLTGSFISLRLDSTFADTLINSFSGPFLLLLLSFILGFCAISQPVEFLIPVYNGLGLGVSLTGMYSRYSAGGVLASLVLIVPNGVISALVLIVAVRESIRMSNSVGTAVFSDRSAFSPIDVRLYFTKFVILSAVLVLSSLIASILTFLFAGLWTRLI